MRPILFIDRDGTIIHETKDEKIDTIPKLRFIPRVMHYLRKIQEETDYLFVMVSNQDGLGTDFFPSEDFWPIHELVIRTLEGEGVHFDDINIDEHFASDNHPNRKPNIGMVEKYMNGQYDIENSYVIGDRPTDVEFARNIGCKAIHLFYEKVTNAVLTTAQWKDVYELLTNKN